MYFLSRIILKIVIFDQNSALKMTIETVFEQVRQRLVIFGITFNPVKHKLCLFIVKFIIELIYMVILSHLPCFDSGDLDEND